MNPHRPTLSSSYHHHQYANSSNKTPPRPSRGQRPRGGTSLSSRLLMTTPATPATSRRRPGRQQQLLSATAITTTTSSSNTIGTTSNTSISTATASGGRSTPYFTPQQYQRKQQQFSSITNSSPSRSAQDRYIPSRPQLNMDLCRRSLSYGQAQKSKNNNTKRRKPNDETPLQKEFKRRMLSTLCNIPLDKLTEDAEPIRMFSYGPNNNNNNTSQMQSNNNDHQNNTSGSSNNSIANTSNSNNNHNNNPFILDVLRSMKVGIDHDDSLINTYDQTIASKVMRKVPSAPVRILDAPDIVDDYYLNLISWSKDNILAVALARSVYLWNATSGEIHHLITVTGSNYITSVQWCQENAKYIAIGTHQNEVHIYDGQALRKIRTLHGASGRIASLSWNGQLLSAGDRDAMICNHDVRTCMLTSKYKGHTQEVCGLKWNDDGTCLASGGNENFLCLWDPAMSDTRSSSSIRSRTVVTEYAPRQVLKQHKAAVKALDWCPFHRGLLASGGGTADRTIKFWNASSGALLNSIDTGSQVCSILWSKHQRELCSSHGYSENQLILWKYPSMTKIKELTGHTARVLNMDMSPDGSSIVSAGADETLRFWNIFDTPSVSADSGCLGALSLGGPTIR